MIVRKIALNGWRNYEFAAAEFSPGTNVITGENAQGKTNLLEAVYLLTGGKSFRTRFDKELIGFGYTSAEVLADVFAFGREQTVRIVLRQGQRKQIWQNGVKKTAAELAGTFAAVLFCPDDLNIIREEGDPGDNAHCRRRGYFYPRPPRGGRPLLHPVSKIHAKISIHALREEGDWRGFRRPAFRERYFYPRPPRGGRLKVSGGHA